MRRRRDQIVLAGTRINTLAFSSDSQFLLASGSDGMARIWKVQDWSQVKQIAANGANCVVAASPSLEQPLAAIALGEWSNEVAIWSLSTQEQTFILKGNKRCIGCMAFSPDGALLAAGARNAGPPPPLNGVGTGISAETHDGSAPLVIWDVKKGAIIASIPGHIDQIKRVVFSPSGMHFASADATGAIRLWKIGVKKEAEKAAVKTGRK
jgi:WD40 repeat protein